MNILKREIKANLKSLLIWSFVIVVIMSMAAVEFDAFKGMVNVDEMMQSFPKEFTAAFSLDAVRLDKPEGYYSYIGQYFMVMAVIFAALAGTRILSKEISKKTAETTFTLPVTRRYMISMKLIAALINCAILTAVIFAGSYFVFSFFDVSGIFIGRLVVFCLLILLLQILFVLFGLFVSVVSKKHKRATTVTASVTVGIYLLSFLINLSDKYEFLKYFSPFEYFNAIDIMNGKPSETFGFIIVPVLIVALFLFSFGMVEKKDII